MPMTVQSLKGERVPEGDHPRVSARAGVSARDGRGEEGDELGWKDGESRETCLGEAEAGGAVGGGRARALASQRKE